ncbi:MAG: NINE protein [Bacteroidales bacterium]|nr:NINE protein [Bacteroidales bacterium]
MKSKGVAYLLWFIGFFGTLGLHRFYLGKIGTGILWICTFGLLGVGAFIDLFTLGGKVDTYNLMHGFIGHSGNQNQNNINVVVNAAPQMPESPVQPESKPAENK